MKKILSMLMSIIMMFSFSMLPTQAKEKLVITSSDYHEVDPYIEVVDNKFVLNLPDNIYIEDENLVIINELINKSNEEIAKNNLIIDLNTKSATLSGVSTRAWGKNDIEFYWNFARVYIDAGNLRIALTVGVGGLGGVLSYLATAGWAAGAIGAVTAALGIAANNIQDGIWFDYNYLTGINNFGFQ